MISYLILLKRNELSAVGTCASVSAMHPSSSPSGVVESQPASKSGSHALACGSLTLLCTQKRGESHTHTHARTHARTYARTHARTHARTLAHTQTHTHTHKHTHVSTHEQVVQQLAELRPGAKMLIVLHSQHVRLHLLQRREREIVERWLKVRPPPPTPKSRPLSLPLQACKVARAMPVYVLPALMYAVVYVLHCCMELCTCS